MKRIAVIANCAKPRAGVVVNRLWNAARKAGLSVVADPATAALVKGCAVQKLPALFVKVDAVVAVGGDGTMLRVVRALAGRDIPLIGVNIGSLGFLTSVAEEDLASAIKCLATGKYAESVRSIADCSVERGGKVIEKYRALNDVVITSGATMRVMTMSVSVDGDNVTSYVADGIIVSTPTGSTGHSLSAGGPIVAPEARAMVVSVICPHTLSTRPLVVPDDSRIVVELVESAGRVPLTIDGQVGRLLEQKDKVHVVRSRQSVRFIHLPGHSYFNVLRQKLRWSGSSR